MHEQWLEHGQEPRNQQWKGHEQANGLVTGERAGEVPEAGCRSRGKRRAEQSRGEAGVVRGAEAGVVTRAETGVVMNVINQSCSAYQSHGGIHPGRKMSPKTGNIFIYSETYISVNLSIEC